MADVDRLMEVDELARLPQPVEELTEIFLHARVPAAGSFMVLRA
jgi:hypothetical protein